jgi:PAS domain S-box-containing protein
LKILELAFLGLASLAVLILLWSGYRLSNGNVAFLFGPLVLPYWAALRFGPAIVSMLTASMVLSTLSAAAYHGKDSFPADDSKAIEMQILLILALSPALLLASMERERKNNQHLARRNEERLELALGAAQMGTWEWDVSADRVTLCEDSKQVFGHLSSMESFSIRAFLDVVHPDDRTMLLHLLTSAMERAGVYEVEFRIFSHDQEVRWIMGKGKVVTDVRSHAKRLVGVHLDITDRKRIEEREQELRHKLVHRSRVAMLGEISGAIAHELNQPLNAILMNAQAAQIDLKSATVHVPVIEEALKDIINAEKRAANVIQGIRALIKKNHLRFHPVVVNDLLREVLYLQRADLTSKSVTVDLKLAEPLAKVEGDQVQLQQVFVNLISNACDAMATDSTTDRIIIIETEQVEESSVQIRISDQGGGIPEDKIGQVFEPFFSTKANGLGLGLSICRTIVSLHRGRMWSMNNSRGGVTFYISLPTVVET